MNRRFRLGSSRNPLWHERGHLDAPVLSPLRGNAVRLQLRALADNLANLLRSLALPEALGHWSMTTLRDRLVKIGAKIVQHGRSITFQMAEVMVPRTSFRQIRDAIAMRRPLPPARC